MDEKSLRQFEAMMEHDHGPCWYFGMYNHLPTVNRMLEELFTWRNEFSAYLAEPPDHGDFTDDACADMAYNAAFADAAISQAAIASIAPLFESLFHNASDRIREAWGALPLPQTHDGRWKLGCPELWKSALPTNAFWNPTLYYRVKRTTHRWVTDIRQGMRQLMQAIGFPNAISQSALDAADAVFAYRHASLHEGYEWRKSTQERFRQLVRARKWDQWFTEYTRGSETWFVVIENCFVADSLKSLNSVARSLRSVKEAVEAQSTSGHPTAD